jgi:hypothetical protein
MRTVIITTQQELDALKDFENYTVIEIRSKEKIAIAKKINNISIRLYDNSSAELYGNSSAELYDNSSAELHGNSSAELYGNSSAELYGNSSAELYDNSSAELHVNSSAELHGNSSAELHVNSSARLYDNSSAELHGNSSAELYVNSSARLHGNSSAELYGNSSARLYDNSSAELHVNSSARLYDNSSARLYGNSSAIGYENSTIINHKKESHGITIYDNATIKQIDRNLKVPFDTWLERGLVVADGIYQELISTQTKEDLTLYQTNKGYVARIGEFFAHGETENEAIVDLRFKMSKRDISIYQEWTKDSVADVTAMIIAYRTITGACSQGTKDFCRSIKLADKYKVSDVIKITKGKYGHEEFANFFQK